MKEKRKHRKRYGKKLIIVLLLAAALSLTGCNPVQTVLGVGELYGDTTTGLIMVLLDSGELETIDGEDPSNQIYIGHQEVPEEDPEKTFDEDDSSDVPEEEDPETEDETLPEEEDGRESDAEDGAEEDETGTDDSSDPDDEGNPSNEEQSPEEEDFRKPAVDYYVYNTLTEEAKGYYDQLLDCVESFDDAIVIQGADGETVHEISTAVLADHGELFWYEGNYSYSEYDENGEPSTSFMPVYTVNEAQKEKYEQQLESVESQWLSGISKDASDYEKVKYVYEQLVERVTYDLSAENNQNILSTFLNERTVCAGFAHAAQVLLQELGVSCTYLTGYGGTQRHAWNLVRIDGIYYYMDATWGNPSYLNAAGTGEPDYIDYSYMNITFEEISKDHTCENTFPLPEANAVEANYFVMEDKYFDSEDFSVVGEAVQKASNAGENLQIKFATDELYRKALNELIVQQKLYGYCPDLGEYTYSFREDAKTLYFFFDTSVL